MRAGLLLSLVIVVPLPRALAAQDVDVPEGPSDSQTVVFLHRLQVAVRLNDSVAVASLMHFPLNVNDSLHRGTVYTPRDFLLHYRRILTPAVRHAVLVQRGDSLFHNWQGTMIGNGQVWFGLQCAQNRPDDCRRLSVYTI